MFLQNSQLTFNPNHKVISNINNLKEKDKDKAGNNEYTSQKKNTHDINILQSKDFTLIYNPENVLNKNAYASNYSNYDSNVISEHMKNPEDSKMKELEKYKEFLLEKKNKKACETSRSMDETLSHKQF